MKCAAARQLCRGVAIWMVVVGSMPGYAAADCMFDSDGFADAAFEAKFEQIIDFLAAGCSTRDLDHAAFDLLDYGENCEGYANIVLAQRGVKPLKCARLRGPDPLDYRPGRSDALEAEILAAHNAARRAVTPPAMTPLPPLNWNRKLARSAQRWADKLRKSSDCDMRHSDARDRRHEGEPAGENLYWNSGVPNTWSAAVDAWVAEKDDLVFGCRETGVIGHYTQVVWDETTEVGCGWASCGREDGHVYVCQYGPAGNVVGRLLRPYRSRDKGCANPAH